MQNQVKAIVEQRRIVAELDTLLFEVESAPNKF